MPQVSVKYKCGDSVRIIHHVLTIGIVTAIFIRGRGRAYEVSYTGDDGPTSVNCEECELEPCKETVFGFGEPK